jgi:hypothetical protein
MVAASRSGGGGREGTGGGHGGGGSVASRHRKSRHSILASSKWIIFIIPLLLPLMLQVAGLQSSTTCPTQAPHTPYLPAGWTTARYRPSACGVARLKANGTAPCHQSRDAATTSVGLALFTTFFCSQTTHSN